jgi:hypothetical protein
MPSATCPHCWFAVPYPEDFLGQMKCPLCAAELLPQRWQPGRQPTTGPEIQADTPADRPVREETYQTTPPGSRREMPLASPPPAAIRWAGAVWVLCGIAAIVFNVLLLLMACLAATITNSNVAFFAVVVLVLFFGAAVVFYLQLAAIGFRFGTGQQRLLQLPAWFVLLAAQGLLLFNTGFGLGLAVNPPPMSPPRPVPVGGGGFLETGMLLFLVWLGGLLATAVLILVDIALIVSSAVLLWHSARYIHWTRGGIATPVPITPPTQFPPSIQFAGSLWVLSGVASLALLLAYWRELSGYRHAGVPVAELVLLIVAGTVTLLTPILLGCLLLQARLPSTFSAGVLFLVLGVFGMLAYFLVGRLDPPSRTMLVRAPWLSDPRELFELLQFVLYFLSMVASLVCIEGDKAYRAWLRSARGLRA